MATAIIQTLNAVAQRNSVVANQPRAGLSTGNGNRGESQLANRLADRIHLSPQAKEKLSELTKSSKDLSDLAKKVRDRADGQEEAARAAKIDRLKKQIEQLKMQLAMVSGKEAKALIKKLKMLAGELKQLAKDVASAGGATVPVSKASGPSMEETGQKLVSALGGAESVAATTTTSDLPSEQPQQQNSEVANGGLPSKENREAPVDTRPDSADGDQRTDREKLADVYLQAFAARPAAMAEVNNRKEELKQIKKMAGDLKLIAGEIKRKMKDDDNNKDLKEINRDLKETLAIKVETEQAAADELSVEGGAQSSPAAGSINPGGQGQGVQAPGVNVSIVQTPIIQVQTYINVQISVNDA